MIKVESIEREDTTVLYFESRTTDEASLAELDTVYGLLMSNLSRVMVHGGYESSNVFSIELKNPS